MQSENQQQAADQVSISNSIGSLRFLGAMDWREFVETMSVVEQTLREDPAGVYGRMDFATRDRYRHVVEKIAEAQPPVRRRGGAPGDRSWRAKAAAVTTTDDRDGACRLLSDRQGAGRSSNAAGCRPVAPARSLRRTRRRLPLVALSGRDRL